MTEQVFLLAKADTKWNWTCHFASTYLIANYILPLYVPRSTYSSNPKGAEELYTVGCRRQLTLFWFILPFILADKLVEKIIRNVTGLSANETGSRPVTDLPRSLDPEDNQTAGWISWFNCMMETCMLLAGARVHEHWWPQFVPLGWEWG